MKNMNCFDKEYDCYFMINSKYHEMALMKPNAFLAKFLSHLHWYRFCLKLIL